MMRYEDHLKILNVTMFSTIPEIKSSYRKLAKLHHPDINKSSDGKFFNQLTLSYDYLIANHAPQKPKAPATNLLKHEKYYRIIPGGLTPTLWFSSKMFERESVIICMKDMTEFNIFIPAGTELPKTIRILNVGRPFELRLQHDGY